MGRVFKPAANCTSKISYRNDNRLLETDSDYELIENYLKSDDDCTIFRMLPSFDENGSEELALNPAGGDDIQDIVGNCFCILEVCDIWKNGKTTFVSSIQPQDREGNSTPSGWSPAMWFMRRLGYKIYAQSMKDQRGQALDIPRHWIKWNQGTISKPQDMFVVQGMAKQINGVVRKNLKKQVDWVFPAIFVIPKSAEAEFMTDITKPKDQSEPLSESNNFFGDFCSCDAGHMLRLARYTNINKASENKKQRKKTTYSLKLDDSMPLTSEQVYGSMKPWSEIIHIPTVEETIEILMDLFEPTAVDFGLRNTPFDRYIPESAAGSAGHIAEAVSIDQIRNAAATPSKSAAKPAAPKPAAPPVILEETVTVAETAVVDDIPFDSKNIKAEDIDCTDQARFEQNLKALSNKVF